MKTRPSFETDTRATLRNYLPPEGIDNLLHHEIAKRIQDNADLVTDRHALRNQVLIILADYRNHAWTGRAFRGEADRITVTNRIMASA